VTTSTDTSLNTEPTELVDEERCGSFGGLSPRAECKDELNSGVDEDGF
jgi:hypothetical protein